MVSKKSKERSKKTKEKQKNILEMLKSHGAKIYEDLDSGQFPKFSIPSRSAGSTEACQGPQSASTKASCHQATTNDQFFHLQDGGKNL